MPDGHRRAGAGADRADGRDQLTVIASRSSPCSVASRTARSVTPLSLELVGRVAVDVGRGAHLQAVPQRTGVVDALQPRHPLVAGRDQHDDELGTALALRRRAVLVGDARAAEERHLDRPAIARPGPGSAAAPAGSGLCPAPHPRLSPWRVPRASPVSTSRSRRPCGSSAPAPVSCSVRRSSARTPGGDARGGGSTRRGS